MIEWLMYRKRRRAKRRKAIKRHFKEIGFTNRLALYILIFLLIGLVAGFYLAILSIREKYVGSLLCWTAALTPIGTAVSVALSRVVDKNRAENTEGGVVYKKAEANNFVAPGDDAPGI